MDTTSTSSCARWFGVVFPLEGAQPAERLRVEQQALDLLLDGLRTAFWTNMLGTVLSAWLFTPYVGAVWAWTPAIILWGLHLERWRHVRRMARARALRDDQPARWAATLVWRVGLSGCVIVAWNHAALRAGSPTAMLYALSLFTVVTAGAMTQYCVWPAVVRAFVTPMLLGMAAQLLWLGHSVRAPGHVVTAVFMIVLWATLITASTRFARALHHNLLLRLRNEALLTEIDHKRQQAEQANAAKTRFLAAASHDLRQPVHAMNLLAEVLTQRLQGSPHAPLMQQVTAGIRSFSDLVDEVLDLARADSLSQPLSLGPVPVQPLLQRAEHAFRATAAQRGLSLWLRAPAHTSVTVQADAAALWRVIGNLLANAVRYTPSGGVMLAVRRATLAGRPAWRLEVRDSGPGIAAEQREAIFEEFHRAHDPHRSLIDSEGHGLGLAVARRMAHAMGTEVRLHRPSTLGPGAVFSITLPAACSEPLADALSEAAPTSHLNGLRLLVVDDDRAAREALVTLLRHWGVAVHGAASLADVQALLAAAPPGEPLHGVITDHWLQAGVLSADVLRAVRSRWPQVRGLIISGSDNRDGAMTSAAGGADFLSKPVRPEALRHWLEELKDEHLHDTTPAAG